MKENVTEILITQAFRVVAVAALAEVARVSKAGNDQHNPGQPLHWARDKSADHADCVEVQRRGDPGQRQPYLDRCRVRQQRAG